MNLDLKTIIASKELHQINSVAYNFERLDKITKAATELIQSIYDSKPKLEEGEVFIETLSIKILLATKSIIELGKGTKVSALTKDSDVKLMDFPSICILTRSIIEAFLTLEYLYYNDLDKKEKIFRFQIWQISGYKSRQSFFKRHKGLRQNITDKLESELNEIERLLSIVKKSPFYKDIDKQNLWKLDKYGLPRLESWQKLLEQSILNMSMFETSYKLYTNFAHSEFISLIQMNGADTLNMGSKTNNTLLLNCLRDIKMINCVSLICLKNRFECVSKKFDLFDEETKTTIWFWNILGTEKNTEPNIL